MNKQAMMKGLLLKKLSPILLGLLLCVPWVGAENYYVKTDGTGSGSSTGDAASFSSLITKLGSVTNASSPLTVYFEPGEYLVPAGGITFPAAGTSMNGLNVTFQPLTSGTDVTFTGPATVGENSSKFVTLRGSSANNMTLTIEGVRIRNFSSTGAGTDNTGTKSLFAVGAYCTLNLNGVRVENISSNRNPLMSLNTNANMYSTDCEFVGIQKLSASEPTLAIFETGATIRNLSFDNCLFDSWKGGTGSNDWSNMFWIENEYTGLTFRDCKFLNNTANGSLIRISTTGTLTVAGCEFTGNTFNNQTQSGLLRTYGGSTVANIYNNSIHDNTTSRMIYLDSGRSTIYNNTISGNTTSHNIYNSVDNSKILNNTVYNSGDLYNSSTTGVVIRNNLVLGTSKIAPSATATGNVCSDNISNNRYYAGAIPEKGTSGGTTLLNLNNYYNNSLTEYVRAVPKRAKTFVHELTSLNDLNHPILRHGNVTGYETILATDQRGVARPQNTNISIGAWDTHSVGAQNVSTHFAYDPDEGLVGSGTLDIDISWKVRLPDGIDGNNANVTVVLNGTLTNGTLTQDPSNKLKFTFIPKPGDPGKIDEEVIDERSTISYTVSYTDPVDGFIYSATADWDVTVVSVRTPLGMIDESYYRCSGMMDENITFEANIKYRTSTTMGNLFYGFSIPIVGDLDGDGYAEIVSLGYSSSSTTVNYTDITIMNGQDGTFIAKIPFNDTGLNIGEFRAMPGAGYHGSPSHIALVDADRNGYPEIIIARTAEQSNTESSYSPYTQRLISLEVNDNTFKSTDELAINDASRLSIKWVSNMNYTQRSETNTDTWTYATEGTNAQWSFNRPLPQIVDIDGDGEPEIVIYNKIYNAVDGTIRVVFDDLGPVTTYDNSVAANRPNPELPADDPYKNYAYTGRNRNAQHVTDRFLTQISVYDLDMDGRYEIIAGGKVYYDLDPKGTPRSGNWKVKSADLGQDGLNVLSIGDGYTAVADVNGDGKAEIIVVYSQDAFADGLTERVHMKVWDPGLLVRNISNTGWEKPANQATSTISLLADMTIPNYIYIRSGSMSFVYVGDIDGKVNTNAYGEKVKLPEISLIGGCFYDATRSASTYRQAVPVHPNADATEFNLAGNGSINYQVTNVNTIYGALMSWTWDEAASGTTDRLKVSFGMEHSDWSMSTGFTFFDFDNDGSQDIVYRDERNLRIISPKRSWVPYNYAGSDVNDIVRFSSPVVSWTGFEYPVVADVDNDGSADMLVMGSTGTVQTYNSIIYTIQEDPNVGKFAPAPNVWNQFHYSPLKINKDLTTPLRNRHPLDPSLGFIKNSTDNTKPDYMVKDYIYNNPITQVVEYSLFDRTSSGGVADEWAPTVPWPNAEVPSGYMDVENKKAVFWIKNTGDATLNKDQMVAVYRKQYGAPTTDNSKTIGYLESLPISAQDIRPGDSILFEYPVSAADLFDVYYFRVLDGSYVNGGTFYPGFVGEANFPDAYKDCNWANNSIKIAALTANADIYNVLQYTRTELRILDNDQYPAGITQNLRASDFVTPDGQGVLSGDWGKIEIAADGQSIYYTAPQSFPNVLEIEYKLYGENDVFDVGFIYIFITESCSNTFAVCYGESIDVCLKSEPVGTTFNWYTDATGLTPTSAPGTLTGVTTEQTFYSKPIVPSPYDLIDFPILPITIIPISDGLVNAEMKWTGAVSTDWNDPKNWQIKNGNNFEAAQFAPNTCVDATLPKGLERYPVLTDLAWAHDVIIEDRAMIARTHNLNYNEAKVSVNFTGSERDRWLMYSAPLRKTYSGDYMLVDYTTNSANPQPIRRAVYMNFFQSDHPDVGLPGQSGHATAKANTFTKPFGSVAAPLPLGKPFNVWIDTDIDTTTPFVFPSPFQTYDYNVHGLWQDPETGETETSPELDRTDGVGNVVSGRFIIEDKPSSQVGADGSFSLAAADDGDEYELIMIPNPFMAYLDMNKFLDENVSAIENAYKVWDGSSQFVTYKLQEWSWYDRLWVIDNPELVVNNPDAPQYVAPLQSFIVAKKTTSTTPELKFNPSTMTITTRPSGTTGDYQLRSATGGNTDPAGLMRIKVSNGSRSNSTVLINIPGAPNSFGPEDSRKTFYDFKQSGYKPEEMEPVLSVYTITSSEDALAINAMSDFSQDIPIGVRLNFEGQISFDFSGIEEFGYPIYLKDGNNVIDLRAHPQYITDIRGNGGDLETFYEVNTRFYLSTNNEVSIEEESSSNNNIYISSKNGIMTITSDIDLMSVEVYSTVGNVVYRNSKPSDLYQIDRLIQGQVYVVKMMTESGPEIRKVIVK